MTAAARPLSVYEATAIVAGYGIGGGILALPYLVSLNGIGLSALVLAAAYALSLVLHLMIAELAAGDGSGRQVVELFAAYLFTGRGGKALTWILFGLMGVAFVVNLAAFISGGSEILAALGLAEPWGGIVFFAAAAAVAAFGLKVLGVAEKWAVSAMTALFAVLVVASLAAMARTGIVLPGSVVAPVPSVSRLMALYGMAMFCFAAIFSVPQAALGLADRPALIPRAVAGGLAINLLLILVVATLSLSVSRQPTAIATVGWGRALGPWAELVGTAFVLLAMLTTYWSISFALSSIIQERLGLGRFPAWLLATLPTLALALAGVAGFMAFMRTAGGAIAVLVAILFVPAYRGYRSARGGPVILPQALSVRAWDWVVVAAYVAMAVGSLLPVR